jgi:hypothetical protein
MVGVFGQALCIMFVIGWGWYLRVDFFVKMGVRSIEMEEEVEDSENGG